MLWQKMYRLVHENIQHFQTLFRFYSITNLVFTITQETINKTARCKIQHLCLLKTIITRYFNLTTADNERQKKKNLEYWVFKHKDIIIVWSPYKSLYDSINIELSSQLQNMQNYQESYKIGKIIKKVTKYPIQKSTQEMTREKSI